MERKNAKWLLGIFIIIVLLIIGIGGKKYMNNQTEDEKMIQEKQIVLQAKKMFKDIKSLQIEKRGEASPGSIFFIIEITNINNKKYKVDLDLGDTSSYSTVEGDHFLETQLGSTTDLIDVYYLSGEREEI